MADQQLTVAAPTIVDRIFKKPLLCGPGPCDVYPSVSQALSLPIISPMCDEYFKVVDDIHVGLQYAFQTKSHLIVPISGSGHSGMETVISNLVAPGEKILIASRGTWDDRAYSMSKRYGLDIKVIHAEPNATFTKKQIEEALSHHQPKALFITHGDSSTGTIQELRGLGDLCHKYSVLLIVDTVVSLIGVPFFMDAWGVDAVYTSTQKAFSGPAGITPVAFSERAEKIINSRTHEPPFYFDIKLLAQQWNCYGDTRVYHHTLSPPLIWALRACLKEIIKETLPVIWARHESSTRRFHHNIRSLPLEFYVPVPSDRLATVTTLILPKGYDYKQFIYYMREKHNILIFGGLGPTAGKTLRVGVMGINSTHKVADDLAAAMANTLAALSNSKL